MSYFTDDPVMDAYRHDAEAEERLKMLPICAVCEEPIQEDKAIHYNGKWCCEECRSDFFIDYMADDFLEKTA